MDELYTSVLENLKTNTKVDECFVKMSDRISEEINSSLEADEKMLILATDVDSLGCSAVMYFLMKY